MAYGTNEIGAPLPNPNVAADPQAVLKMLQQMAQSKLDFVRSTTAPQRLTISGAPEDPLAPQGVDWVRANGPQRPDPQAGHHSWDQPDALQRQRFGEGLASRGLEFGPDGTIRQMQGGATAPPSTPGASTPSVAGAGSTPTSSDLGGGAGKAYSGLFSPETQNATNYVDKTIGGMKDIGKAVGDASVKGWNAIFGEDRMNKSTDALANAFGEAPFVAKNLFDMTQKDQGRGTIVPQLTPEEQARLAFIQARDSGNLTPEGAVAPGFTGSVPAPTPTTLPEMQGSSFDPISAALASPPPSTPETKVHRPTINPMMTPEEIARLEAIRKRDEAAGMGPRAGAPPQLKQPFKWFSLFNETEQNNRQPFHWFPFLNPSA